MPYLHVMAEIPQFVYYLTITPQNSTPAKNTPEVWEYGIFYGHTFILLLMYVRTIILKILLFVVCAVVFLLRVKCVYVLWIFHNLWQIRTILNPTVRYGTVQLRMSPILFDVHTVYIRTFVCRLSFEDMKKREIIKNKAKILSVVKKSVFEFSLFYFSQSLHYFSL